VISKNRFSRSLFINFLIVGSELDEKLVRRMLDGEMDLAKDCASTSITHPRTCWAASRANLQRSSWWLKDVRIALLYASARGTWLQTVSEATANVRILGPSSVRWQDVSHQTKGIFPSASLALTTSSGGHR
jgi:hypothetical protein